MSFGGFIITNAGRNEIAKAEMGEPFSITDIVFGEGTYNGSFMSISEVVTPIMTISVSKITRKESEVYLEIEFSSKDVPRAFYFREIGIIANGVLCYYDNCGNEAEYIDPDADNLIKQKRMRFVLLISSEVNINVTVASTLYVLEEDFLKHANEKNPHKTDAEAVGLGNVPNVATNDQTPTYSAASTLATLVSGEKLSVSMGKIMKAITDLINHLANKSNPHEVTKSQIGLDNVDNTADKSKPVSVAQQAAIDAAYANSNYYTDEKIAALINGAPSTLDTLKEIAEAMTENEDIVEALEESIGKKANEAEFSSHVANTSNPHGVTKAQVGLGNVPNVSTDNQTPTYSAATTLATLVSGEKLSVSMGKIMKAITDLISHLANKSNPHSVTKAQVGLGNCNNTADSNKSVKYATSAGKADNATSYYKSDGSLGNIAYDIEQRLPKTGGTLSGTVNVKTTGGGTLGVTVNSGTHGLTLMSSGSWCGLWDDTFSDWIMYRDSNGGITLGDHLKVLGNIVSDESMRATYYMGQESQDVRVRSGGSSNSACLMGATVKCINYAGTGNVPVYASAFSQVSSKRYKENIKEMTEEEALKLLSLNPVTYDYINKLNGTNCMGLIAEEVADVMSYPVIFNEDGEPDGVDYSKFVAPIIKLIKLQDKRIAELEKNIKSN